MLDRLDAPLNELDDAFANTLSPQQIDSFIEALDLLRANPDLIQE